MQDRSDPAAIAEAEQIVFESKGSPYFLSELAQHARDSHSDSQLHVCISTTDSRPALAVEADNRPVVSSVRGERPPHPRIR